MPTTAVVIGVDVILGALGTFSTLIVTVLVATPPWVSVAVNTTLYVPDCANVGVQRNTPWLSSVAPSGRFADNVTTSPSVSVTSARNTSVCCSGIVNGSAGVIVITGTALMTIGRICAVFTAVVAHWSSTTVVAISPLYVPGGNCKLCKSLNNSFPNVPAKGFTCRITDAVTAGFAAFLNVNTTSVCVE